MIEVYFFFMKHIEQPFLGPREKENEQLNAEDIISPEEKEFGKEFFKKVKEFIKRYVRSDDLIILKPVSSDPSHRSIILGEDATYKIFGKVLRTIRIPKSADLNYAPGY